MKGIFRLAGWYFRSRKQGFPFDKIFDDDYTDWFIKYRNELKQFENIHKGKDCFIIGNGPSLNKTNLDLLEGYYVFGLNKIHLIFEKYRSLKIDYHVTVNPLVIEQIQKELDNNIYNCPSFISYDASKGFSYKHNGVYRILSNANGVGKWSFHPSLLGPISEGFTVTFVAMQIAYYMGFKNVFLVGVDHNFQQKGKPNEQQNFKGEDVNHFHPDYFKGQQWHLADLEGNEASYALAKHQFHADERQIFDATVEGKLQVFEKITFKDALNLAKKK